MTGIADTGFIVAFINPRDQYHHWAVRVPSECTGPLITCEPVVTEAAYMVADVERVLRLFSNGLLKLDFDLESNRNRIRELAFRFADQQPDFTDLCVVRMSELFPERVVVTTDRRDFTVYRRFQREPVPAIFPPE